MFERFTDRARRVVVLSQEEARRLNHDYIGTEHLLLGLLQEKDGVGVRALTSLGVSLDEARTRVEQIIGQGTGAATGHVPFTPRAKKVLELSLREALQLDHTYIGTEHLLLGLIREGEGVAAQVLVRLGAELAQVRSAVISTLERAPAGPAGAPGRTQPTGAVIRSLEQENRTLRAEIDRLRHLLLRLGGQTEAPAGGHEETPGESDMPPGGHEETPGESDMPPAGHEELPGEG